MARRGKTKTRKRAVKARRRTQKSTRSRKAPATRRSVKRPSKKAKTKRSPKARKPASTRATPAAPPRLDRARRILSETPAASLDAGRYTAAARSGRKALDRSHHEHTGMTPSITGGDLDADWENAYFSGDEAPGGDNLTPDQESVEDMGEALGVSYQDNEELKGSDKVVERDKHRWELDPASADDYKKDRE